MERGLLWMPLLLAFVGLTWLGWRSYRQVETYRQWATDFDTSKYDTASAIGLKHSLLTWGLPTSQGVTHLQTIDLAAVDAIQLVVDSQVLDWAPSQVPDGKSIALRFLPQSVDVPFVDIKMAVAWWKKVHEIMTKTKAESRE